MIKIEVNLEECKATAMGESDSMTNLVSECFMAIQTMFSVLLEKDTVAAIAFLRGTTSGVPFISEIASSAESNEDRLEFLHELLNVSSGGDKGSDSDTARFVESLIHAFEDQADSDTNFDPESIAPIFKGIMFTKGKKDKEDDADA
jgi:hypothetical protein